MICETATVALLSRFMIGPSALPLAYGRVPPISPSTTPAGRALAETPVSYSSLGSAAHAASNVNIA